MNNNTWTNLLSGAIGSFIVFFLSVIYNNYQDWKHRRLENRPYLNIEMVSMYGRDINNLKIILTINYNEFISGGCGELIDGNNLGYIKFKNLGTNIIINCEIVVHFLDKKNKEIDSIEANIPLIDKQDEFYICIVNTKVQSLDSISEYIEVKYQSITGENLRLNYEYINGNGEEHYNQWLECKTLFGYKKVFKYDGLYYGYITYKGRK